MIFPFHVSARFYENVEPIDRGNRYEDPLQAALTSHDAGTVDGGGSQLAESGLLAFAEVEIDLKDLASALELTIITLEAAGAPRGSEIRQNGTVLREFGLVEILAIFLDGVGLPQEVYDTLDFEDLLPKLEAAAGANSFRGMWAGSEETGLFYGGENAAAMLSRVEALLRTVPIGQNARLVARYGKASLSPQSIRLPAQASGG